MLPAGKIDALVEPDRIHRDLYLSEALFALEQQRLFSRTWLFAGHLSQVPEAGDFVQVDLAGLELRFLQAEDVGVEGLERIHEAFLHDSPQAVDVPGNKFCHANHLSSLYI